MDSSLQAANTNASIRNEHLFEALKSRTEDWKTREKAMLWFPKAQEVRALTARLLILIAELEQRLLKNKQADSDQTDAVESLFAETGRGNELFDRLSKYQLSLNMLDSGAMVETKAYILPHLSSDSIDNKKIFYRQHFDGYTAIEAKASLNTLRSQILSAEGKYLGYLLGRMAYDPPIWDCTVPEAIVAQNAKVLSVGDELEITAGIGSFTYNDQQAIIIGSKKITLNDRALAVYKFKTPNRPGNYSLPVKVSFTDQDGNSQERTFKVEYTLVSAAKANE